MVKMTLQYFEPGAPCGMRNDTYILQHRNVTISGFGGRIAISGCRSML